MSGDVWPPPPENILQVLYDDLRDYEEQRMEAERKILRLTDSNEAFRKRCHHYEKQIALYEKTIDHLIEVQIRSRDW